MWAGAWFHIKKREIEKGGNVMAKSMKKLLSLLLVVALSVTCFTACSSKKKQTYSLRDVYTDRDIELSYAFWEDTPIFEKILADWNAKYPRITIVGQEFDTGSFNESLKALFAADEAPDIFGVIGSIDFAIENGMLLDMTQLWELDPESKNVLGGINEFKIGYFSTQYKWVTPIKFYPQAAFVNKYMVENYAQMSMPSTEWTWEEFAEFVTDISDKKYDGYPLIGLKSAGGCLPVTWYPIMADGQCVGEFGWTEADGGSYNMQNWAVGLNIQRDWIAERILVRDDESNFSTYVETTYGEGVIPQDEGYVAVRGDTWYSFTRYFDNEQQPMLGNNVIFVPYMQPHKSTVAKEDYTYIGIMDVGGINANQVEYAREAYEALKFFTWGTEGWEAKLKYYPDMVEDTTVEGASTAFRDGAKMASNFPITLDDGVWEKFLDIYTKGEDTYGRYDYFRDFFAKVKASRWVCLGAPQIPGFGTWLDTYYFAEDFELTGTYTGIEDYVLNGGGDATGYYKQIEEKGNEFFQNKLNEIEVMLQ